MKRINFILTALAFFPALVTGTKVPIFLQENKGFKVKAGQARIGAHYRMKGVTLNLLDVKISGKDTDGALVVFEQNGLTPGGGPPLHIHPNQDEWFYIISGQYEFQVGNERFHLEEGDTIFLPRSVPHTFIQLSRTGKVLVSFLPAGKMEDFFAFTHNWNAPPTKDEIYKAFEDHDMQVVGPPL